VALTCAGVELGVSLPAVAATSNSLPAAHAASTSTLNAGLVSRLRSYFCAAAALPTKLAGAHTGVSVLAAVACALLGAAALAACGSSWI
jgi:hypothetical protein